MNAPSGNHARALATQGRRRSGAAGKHGDRRLKRLRSRAATKAAAIRRES